MRGATASAIATFVTAMESARIGTRATSVVTTFTAGNALARRWQQSVVIAFGELFCGALGSAAGSSSEGQQQA